MGVFSYRATFGSLNCYCKHFRFRTHFAASNNCIMFYALIFPFSPGVVLPFYSITYVCVYAERHTYHDCEPVHSATAVTETTHPTDDDGIDGYEEPDVTLGTAATFPCILTTIGNALL